MHTERHTQIFNHQLLSWVPAGLFLARMGHRKCSLGNPVHVLWTFSHLTSLWHLAPASPSQNVLIHGLSHCCALVGLNSVLVSPHLLRGSLSSATALNSAGL